MFVQLNPDVESYSETVSTLKFAERVSGVELGAAKSNKEGRGVKELMDQVLYSLFSFPFVLWSVRVPTLMPLSLTVMMHSRIHSPNWYYRQIKHSHLLPQVLSLSFKK